MVEFDDEDFGGQYEVPPKSLYRDAKDLRFIFKLVTVFSMGVVVLWFLHYILAAIFGTPVVRLFWFYGPYY